MPQHHDVGSPAGRLSLHQVVGLSVALGAASLAAAFWFPGAEGALFRPAPVQGTWLLAALAALTCAAELVAVRVRHGDDAVEELTLLDGVVMLNLLVLPVRQAVLVSLGGVLLAYTVRRRPPIKMMYNVGVYASGATTAAAVLHGVSPVGAFDVRLVLGLTAATAAFVAVNLAHMALLLGAINGAPVAETLRQDATLAILTVLGTAALTGTVLVMAVQAPVLLPYAVLPAVALWYSYRASAAKHEERRRSALLLEYSQVLVSGPTRAEALLALLSLLQEQFDAAAAMALFDDGDGLRIDPRTLELQPVVTGPGHHRLLAVPELALLPGSEAPFGWQGALVAPLTIDGNRVGAVVVGGSGRVRLRQRDLTAISPLAGSLAVALQNADRLARLVEETSKLRSVVDQAGDGIVVVSREGTVQLWSPAMETITAVSPQAAVGARLVDLLVAEDGGGEPMDPFAAGRRLLSPATPQGSVDVQLLRPDGERRSTRFIHAGAFDGEVLLRDVVIVRDLTAEWQAERMKSDFIATVSHELRTPLTPIKGYAQMLRTRGDSIPLEKRTRALEVIVDRAEHLGRLVEDLLAASRIAADHEPTHAMATSTADLAALARRACEDFPASARRIDLQVPADPVLVACDPTRVVQVASNLISNALKYSPADSAVSVTAHTRADLGYLVVRDHGQGIPADQIERIFDKFHRVEDPMVMSTGGTGLGLFIARQLARAMHGDLTGTSTPGAGSTFTFSLPAVPPPGEDPPRRRAGKTLRIGAERTMGVS